MRKPISKHALRRALSKVHTEGRIHWEEPIGAVVDRIWHELEKTTYDGGRKKAIPRDTVRSVPVVEPPELE